MSPMENEKGRQRRRRSNGRAILPVTVVTRPQTPEEERHYMVAFRLFLIELARQQLAHRKE